MNILVTGAGGYFGRFMADYLQRYFPGYKIYYLDKVFPCHIKDGVSYIVCDLKDSVRFKNLLTKIKPVLIFNLAGSGISINYSWRDFFDMNFIATKSLLETINSIKGYNPRVILMGSAAEYGSVQKDCNSKKDYPRVIREDAPLNPLSAYGCAKALQTVLARYYVNCCGNDIVIIRPFNIIGPDMSPHTAIGNFQHQIKKIISRGLKTARIYVGDIKVKRDYLDIRDAMRAFCQIVQKGTRGEIYNVSSGKSVSLEYILKTMCSYCRGVKIEIVVEKKFLRKNDVSNVCGSNEKLNLCTGWRPVISIKKSIDDWYKTISDDEDGN